MTPISAPRRSAWPTGSSAAWRLFRAFSFSTRTRVRDRKPSISSGSRAKLFTQLGGAQGLLHGFVEGGHVLVQAPESLAEAPAQQPLEDHGGNEDDRGHHRHGRVKEPERREHANEPHGRFERGRGDPGDEAGRGLDVVKEPGHQVSRAAAVEEVEGEALQVAVELLLKVRDQRRRRARRQPAAEVRRRAARDRDGEGQEGQAEQSRRGDRGHYAPVDEPPEQHQEPQVGGGGGQEAEGRDGEEPRVVSPQAQEPDVRIQINGPES